MRARHVRHRRRQPMVDGRPDRGDGRGKDHPLGAKIVGPVGVVLLLAAALLAVDEWGTVPAIGVDTPPTITAIRPRIDL